MGIRFPSAVTVRNVYITTGNNGRDVLSDIILEYSTDEKNWKKLAAGSFGSEVYFEKLSITAKALRVRCGDQSSPNWVIIRSFEANTTRRPASSGRKVDTNMPVYQNYVPENAEMAYSSCNELRLENAAEEGSRRAKTAIRTTISTRACSNTPRTERNIRSCAT